MAAMRVADSERGQHGRQIPRLVLLQLDRLVATRLPLELRDFHSQTVIHFPHTRICPCHSSGTNSCMNTLGMIRRYEQPG